MRGRVLEALFSPSASPPKIQSGRYRILDELGRGGMGVVYRAHDPKLHRDVALKVMRLGRLDPHAQARMIREARAMARLSHPNVVGVHDVEFDGPEGVVVVMEYVDGQPLHGWLRSEPRSWSTIVPKFLDAGRGLAAAHAAGLLHRDFKPSNVLLGADGRARVADFGLARVVDLGRDRVTDPDPAPVTGDLDSTPPPRASTSLTAPLTTCGALLGTLDFMAPEQLQGGEASTLSDQYAFCVSLWWAIAGTPPFPAAADHERAKLDGPPPWNSPARAPRRLVSALRRGLSPAPSDRWPSMDALLDALSAATRKRLGAGFMALGVVGLGLTMLTHGPSSADAPGARCDGATRLGDVWSDARREAIEDRLLDAPVPYAARAWTRTEAHIDELTARWVEMYEQSCQTALGVTAEVSLEPVPAMRCLQQSRLELEATVDRLAEPGSIEQLDELLDGLPTLDRCRGARDAPPHLVPPPEDVELVEGVERQLATVKSLLNAGKHQAAREQLERARAMAEGLSYAPIFTTLELEHGRVLSALGHFDAAEAAYKAAQEQGVRLEQWREVAVATRLLMHHVATKKSRPQEALRLAELARGFAARLEDPTELAATLAAIADVRTTHGDYPTAMKELDEALRIWVDHRGDDDSVTASIRRKLATVLSAQGELEAAQQQMREALALQMKLWGARHPNTVTMRGDLATILYKQGRVEEAEREVRATTEMLVEQLGEDHPRVGVLYANLAVLVRERDQFEEAIEYSRRALAIFERAGMRTTLHAARAHGNLADAYVMLGDFEGAVRETRLAIELIGQSAGPENPRVGHQQGRLGDLLTALGRFDEAEPPLRDALRILVAAQGEDHRGVGSIRESLGALLYERGDDLAGLAELRAAVRILERALAPDHNSLLLTRNLLAQQLCALERFDEAEAEFRTVIEAAGDTLEPEHWVLITARTGQGAIALKRGELAGARRILEHQWSLYGRGPSLQNLTRARTALTLAQALWHEPAQRRRALELVRGVSDDETVMGLAGPRLRGQIERWLATHG